MVTILSKASPAQTNWNAKIYVPWDCIALSFPFGKIEVKTYEATV